MKNLELKWVFQARSLEKFEATPLVVDGIMYTVQAPNDIVALDAVTGRVFWTYSYSPSPQSRPCCGRVNRGVAILGDTLFMGTIDAHLIAIDAKNGRPLWNTTVAKPEAGYAITHAPLVVKDKVIVGVAGGEFGIRGFIAAYDVKTGKEDWRFNTIPGPGEPGHETWAGDSWKTGGASVWMTGSYDPASESDLLGNRQSRARLERRSARAATISTAVPWSRSMPIPASSNGITSSRRTMNSTTTPCRCRCWPTSTGRASRAR